MSKREMCSLSFSPTLVQFSPPSMDLYTPSPTETLLRIQLSPVATHRIFGFCGSTAIAPMDGLFILSKIGLKVTPPSSDLNTPPAAPPTKIVSRLPGMAANADTRPPITAGPMDRAV